MAGSAAAAPVLQAPRLIAVVNRVAVTALVVLRVPVVVMACSVVLVVAVVDLVPGALLAVPACGAGPPQAASSQRAVTSVSDRALMFK